MKIISAILLAALLFACIMYGYSPGSQSKKPAEEVTDASRTDSSRTSPLSHDSPSSYTALNYATVKAIWLSQFDMTEIYTEGGKQREIFDYKAKLMTLFNNLQALEINTLFVQVRPNGDSIYPSEIYPTSKYVSGKYGKDIGYDPFAILLEYAHERSISVHAWINPLRCMSVSELSSIPKDHEIKRWFEGGDSDKVVSVNGYCYLNPAHRETRALICSGVSEILCKYNVDGIHLDDYFYPTASESFDALSYAEYKHLGGSESLGDFRREQINTLVREIYSTVKNRNHTVLFGISPGGNTSRNYNELFADVAAWCSSDCYVDYICPQIYFGFEHETHPFDDVCDEFSEMISQSKVKLIAGITLGKAYDGYNGKADQWAGDGGREWINNRDILKRSVEYADRTNGCCGVALFSYRLLFDAVTGTPIIQTRDEVNALIPAFKQFQ